MDAFAQGSSKFCLFVLLSSSASQEALLQIVLDAEAHGERTWAWVIPLVRIL
jgi:hypothetical protein